MSVKLGRQLHQNQLSIQTGEWKGEQETQAYLFASIQLQTNPTLVKLLNSNIILCKIRSGKQFSTKKNYIPSLRNTTNT